MAANVKSMFYRGETPWHGLGKKIADDAQLSVAEALESAGANYSVETVPQFTHDIAADGTIVSVQTEQVAIRHSESKAIYGYSGKRYVPYQNASAFAMFQPLLDAGDIRFETGGVLGEGEICWVLAQIQRPNLEIVRGDEVQMKLLLSNPHDGLKAISFGLTPIRVVCQNTLAMALSNSQSKIVRVKHNKNTEVNLEMLRDALSADLQSFETTAEKYRLLAHRGCNKSDLLKYVKQVCGVEEGEEISTRMKNTIDRIIHLSEEGMGQKNNPLVSGTWWAAYNGVTEYLNYEKGNNENNRLTNLWFKNEGKLPLDLALTLSA